ncbi:uncharacterized protein M8220_001792 isoform 3-T3 [Acridotheres tristis]
MQQAHKASLLYSTEGDMKKGSLGPPKAASPAVSSASWSLHSSLQLDVQESQEMSSMSNPTPYAPRPQVVVWKRKQSLEASQDENTAGLGY